MTEKLKVQSCRSRPVRSLRREMAARVVGLRQKKGWSQEALAARLDVPRERLAKWETGRHGPPEDILVKLGEVLEVTVDELLTGHNPFAATGRQIVAMLEQRKPLPVPISAPEFPKGEQDE
jgi:transcriptional regulator with XRE-family HTH domain